MKLSSIKNNPTNPRLIKDEKFEKLVKSITEFPKMMKLRPIIVDNNNVIIGGNMRYKALKHLGYKEIPDEWVKKASELTEDERKRFIIADNVEFGSYDFDILANEFDIDELTDWGLEDISRFDTKKINELSEWNESIGEFSAPDDEIKIIIYFNTESERERFVSSHKLDVTNKNCKQWTVR